MYPICCTVSGDPDLRTWRKLYRCKSESPVAGKVRNGARPALWSGTNKNRNVITGPLARPFARLLAPLTVSQARGKVNDSTSQNQAVLNHRGAAVSIHLLVKNKTVLWSLFFAVSAYELPPKTFMTMTTTTTTTKTTGATTTTIDNSNDNSNENDNDINSDCGDVDNADDDNNADANGDKLTAMTTTTTMTRILRILAFEAKNRIPP